MMFLPFPHITLHLLAGESLKLLCSFTPMVLIAEVLHTHLQTCFSCNLTTAAQETYVCIPIYLWLNWVSSYAQDSN